MRNLSILRDSICKFPVEKGDHDVRLCTDSDTSHIYAADVTHSTVCCLSGLNQVLWTRNLRENLEDTSDDSLGPRSRVAGVAYLQELEALCITATGGEILLVQGPKEVQEVGKLQEGIICSAWSPDQEFLAICTGSRQLVLMNKEWEVLAEDSVDAVHEPEDDIPSELNVSNGASITWRGDGKYFATVSAPAGSDVASSLRVWQTEGCALHAVGKTPSMGLYTVLAWQPNGRHLYAAHAQGPHHRVVLYETNGLEHGGFDVPRSGRLTQLSWSSNSELLAVVLTNATAGDKQGNEDVLQIWHRSNWHWYLKQEQVYAEGQGVRVRWDEVAALRLHVASGAGWYRQVDLAMERTVSRSGTAAVVDGATLLLTPLQRALVPPPMCAVAAVFPHSVQCLAFGTHQGHEVVAGVTSSNELIVVQAKEGDLWEPTTEAELDDMETEGIQQAVIQPHTVALAGPLVEGAIIRSIVWLTGSSSLLVIGTPVPEEGGGEQEHTDILQQLSISWEDGTEQPTATATTTERASGCIRIAEAAAHEGALLQMQDGSMWTYASRDDEGLSPCGPGANFPMPCPFMVPTPLAALQHLGGDTAPAVGLSEGGQLYWGSAPIQGACTSVAVRGQGPGGPFLLYTTRDTAIPIPPEEAAWLLPGRTVVAKVVYSNPNGFKVEMLDDPRVGGWCPVKEAPYVLRENQDDLKLAPDDLTKLTIDIMPIGTIREFRIMKTPQALSYHGVGPMVSARVHDLDVLWARTFQLFDLCSKDKETFTVTVLDVNQGGLICRCQSLQAFIPISQLNRERDTWLSPEDMAALKGKDVEVTVIEVDPEFKKIVLSMSRAVQFKQLRSIHLGALMWGEVRRVEEFGAFIGLEGTRISGLLHVSNISRSRVESVSDVFQIGERVRCLVMGMDENFTRISLSTAELEVREGDIMYDKEKVYAGAEAQAQLFMEYIQSSRDQSVDDDFDFDGEREYDGGSYDSAFAGNTRHNQA